MAGKSKLSLIDYFTRADKRRLVWLVGLLLLAVVALGLVMRSINLKSLSITGEGGTDPVITNQATGTYCTDGDSTCTGTNPKTSTSNTVTITKQAPDPDPSVCLNLSLQLRSSGEMDHNAIKLIFIDSATNQTVTQIPAASSDATGRISITDGNITRLLDNTKTYTVTASMLGYAPRTVTGLTNITSACGALGTFSAGDVNGDGSIKLSDLVIVIRYFNGSSTEGTNYIFKGKRATLSMLIAIIRNYNAK